MTIVVSALHEIGAFALFYKKVLATTLRSRCIGQAVMAQTVEVTIRSFPTVAFAGLFIGAILVLQFNDILAQYDAQVFLGGLNTSSVVREVGPLIISFLLAGKVGAYTAAELGTMRVTEQIDAIECLGTNPVEYLIVPRFIGIIASSLILLTLGLMVSVFGSMIVAITLCGMNYLQYLHSVPQFTDAATLAGAAFRSFVYGVIVAGVSTYQGFYATGGARGVGRAVTLASVYTNLYIVISNYAVSGFLQFVARIWGTIDARIGGGLG